MIIVLDVDEGAEFYGQLGVRKSPSDDVGVRPPLIFPRPNET